MLNKALAFRFTPISQQSTTNSFFVLFTLPLCSHKCVCAFRLTRFSPFQVNFYIDIPVFVRIYIPTTMPSIPRFSLSQTSAHLTVTINVPYIRVSSAETHVDLTAFSFSCKPYLLKLTLPGPVLDNEENAAVAVYNPNVDNGTLTITMKKMEDGDFPDLDLTTKLLQPRVTAPTKQKSAPPLIEVIDSSTAPPLPAMVYDETVPDEETPVASSLFNISAVASGMGSGTVAPPLPQVSLSIHPTYGFAQKFSRCFDELRDELKEMCETDRIDSLGVAEKRELRGQVEKEKFDAERYCGDFFVNDERFVDHNPDGPDPLYEAAMSYIPSLESLSLGPITFTPDEQSVLASLPHKEHLLSGADTRSALLSLLDILFAFFYDNRLTEGESSVESAWTMSILSPTLSWFDAWGKEDKAVDALMAGVKRSLIYPYLRLFKFATDTVVGDVIQVLKQGRRAVIRALLKVKGVFDKSETHYLINKFYIDDYIVWLQKIDEGMFAKFAAGVRSDWDRLDSEQRKAMVKLDLEEAEELVLEQLEA